MFFAGEIEVVKELLRTGYNIDAKDQNGQTALHLACLAGEPKIAYELLEHGASTNCLDGKGYTPLHYACRQGHLQCVEYLLQHAASTTIPTLGSRWVCLNSSFIYGMLLLFKIISCVEIIVVFILYLGGIALRCISRRS